jgi:dipeptidyl aminopeptidase/acylaminoacyl peptidase
MSRILLFCVLISFTAFSQDGKIIEQVQYTLPDSLIEKLPTIVTEAQSISETVNFYRITYLSDGLKVKGYLAKPKKEGKYPCIIVCRGGNKNDGIFTDQWFAAYGQLCNKGYVIVGSQYRGNDGGEGTDEFGGKEVNDVLNLVPLLASIPQADTSRIGMYGISRGSMMVYLALTRTNSIKAVVDNSGLRDLIKWIEVRPNLEQYFPQSIPDYNKDKMAALKKRSAVYFAEKINKTTPVLILQGTADWRSPTVSALDIAKKFYEVKQPFRLIIYEGAQHGLREYRSDFFRQMLNWFDFYVRDGKQWPSLEPHGE